MSPTLRSDGEKYVYEYFCQNNVCRVCWKLCHPTKLSTENDFEDAQIVLQYLNIDLSEGVPNQICKECLGKIYSFNAFKKSCQESEQKLQNIISEAFQSSINYQIDETILKREVDFELKLLAAELKNENLDELILKQDIHSVFETDENVSNNEDVLPEVEYFCFICNLKIDSNDEFKKHNLTYHKVRKDKEYKCVECQKIFSNLSQLEFHETKKCIGVKFDCKLCTETFKTYNEFENHTQAHSHIENLRAELPFIKCSKCNAVFEDIKLLRKHMRTHKRLEQNEEKYICEVCGRIFNRRSGLDTHMRIHKSYKSLKCPFCNYRATLSGSLKIHIFTHTGERPYACDKCPQRCISRSNLKKHLKTHSDEKEYSCHVCLKMFRYNSSLRDHVSSCHAADNKYECQKCGSRYFRFKGLKFHMIVKHAQGIKQVKDGYVEVPGEVSLPKRRKKNITAIKNDAESSQEAGMSPESE